MARSWPASGRRWQGNPASGAENPLRSTPEAGAAEGRKSPARAPPPKRPPPSPPRRADDEGGIRDVVA